MHRTRLLIPAALLSLLTVTGCAPAAAPAAPSTGAAEGATPPASTSAASTDRRVEGTVLRFASERATVDVTVGEDNPTVRDLLSRLPLQLTAEEFAGREKIADVPGGLATEGSPGSDPEDGDLIYFTPWGNLGFYYDASGIGFSADTIHIGTYDATRQQLDRLEGAVTVSVLD